MMNNWYNRINGMPQVQQRTPSESQISGIRFQNPMQKMNYIMQAMRNPAAFVREQFPDVPENIRNNPDEILRYLQQTRGSQFAQDMQQVSGMCGRR